MITLNDHKKLLSPLRLRLCFAKAVLFRDDILLSRNKPFIVTYILCDFFINKQELHQKRDLFRIEIMNTYNG